MDRGAPYTEHTLGTGVEQKHRERKAKEELRIHEPLKGCYRRLLGAYRISALRKNEIISTKKMHGKGWQFIFICNSTYTQLDYLHAYLHICLALICMVCAKHRYINA